METRFKTAISFLTCREANELANAFFEGDPHHVLPPLHELLVDDLASIVLPGLDVYGLLDDGIRPTPECLAGAVLGRTMLSC